MLTTTKITRKGQITVPINYRRLLGLEIGGRVGFEPHPVEDKVLLLKPVLKAADLRGSLVTKKKYDRQKAREAFMQSLIKGEKV